ncbi:MAG: hypothetical protein FD122_2957 [Stygiobacter sp.]|nr:MAG: hypothetical protein FD122_2957 [Stygiobacter sp.]
MNRIIIVKSLLILLFILRFNAVAQNNEFTIEKLVGSSNAIIQGKVTKIDSWTGVNGRIYSDVKFKVSSVFKGKVKQNQELNFRLLGGTLGKRRTTVFELPHFEENVTSFLFLRSIGDNYDITNALVTVEGAQGKFDVVENGKVIRDKFMFEPILIRNGNGYKKMNNKNSVLLSEFLNQIELLTK